MYLKYQDRSRINPKDWIFSEEKIAHIITHVYKSRQIFSNTEILLYLKEIIKIISKKWNINILDIGIDYTHIHIIILLKPYSSVTKIVRILKGGSSYYLRKKYFFLKKEKRFWSDSFYVKFYNLKDINIPLNYVKNKNCTAAFSGRITKIFLDLLFPIQCLGGCKTWDTWLCNNCLKKITEKNKIILNNNLSGLYYLTSYRNELIQKLIYQLKYQYSEDVAKILGSELAKIIDQNFDYIIPVPLHRKRYAERGFNQAELLGHHIVGTCHGMSLQKNIISRTKYTSPQAQLSHEERKVNLQDIFSIKKEKINIIENKKILLIDDVYTTGATINECAKILKKNGAKEIWGITVAKG
jgi:ComF family protein